MQHFRSKYFHISWLLAIIITGIAVFYIERHFAMPVQDIPKFDHQALSPGPSSATSSAPDIKSSNSNRKSLLLPVPFSPQAPTGNWDQLHNEACEETSAIMAQAYFSNDRRVNLPPGYVEGQLSKITDWEKQSFGYYLDIDSYETAKLIIDFYHLNAKVVNDMNEVDIKNELSQDHLILWPANGRKLGNPNFRQPGPIYHMLVIKGYNSGGIVTNDPGTRKGLNYMYSYQTLHDASGNWSHNENIVDEGNKTAIVVWK